MFHKTRNFLGYCNNFEELLNCRNSIKLIYFSSKTYSREMKFCKIRFSLALGVVVTLTLQLCNSLRWLSKLSKFCNHLFTSPVLKNNFGSSAVVRIKSIIIARKVLELRLPKEIWSRVKFC